MVIRNVDLGHAQLAVRDAGSGPPLLLVHGFPLDHTMWSGQWDHYQDRYRVLAPDLAGFGQSSAIDGVYSMRQFADDLAAMLAAMELAEPVIFCGLSMGGYIAWQFWQHHRQRLAGFVLCDTRAAADSEEVATGRRYMAQQVLRTGIGSIAEDMANKLFAPSTLDSDPPYLRATQEIMRSTRPESIAAAQRGMADREDATSLLAQIDVPTLVIAGQHDVISTPTEMQSIADQIAEAEFQVVPDAGHLAPLEQPTLVNRAIDQFLRSVSSTT